MPVARSTMPRAFTDSGISAAARSNTMSRLSLAQQTSFGVVMALADSTGGACAFLNLPDGAGGTATIESKTNFLAPIRSGTIRAHSRPLHIGTRTIVLETEVRGDDGKLAAKVLQTQAIL